MSSVLTVTEAAQRLKLSTYTVKKLLNEGRLRGVRTGAYGGKWRISENAIEAFLNPGSESLSA